LSLPGISSGAPAIVRYNQEAVAEILNCVRDGTYCALMGPRLSGKTVLLRHVVETLSGPLGQTCVYLDLYEVEASTLQGFFADLVLFTARSVEEQAGASLPVPDPAVASSAVFRGFLGDVVLHLQTSDFSTAMQVVDRINDNFGSSLARARDISTIEVGIPDPYQGNLVPFIAALENLPVTPDSRARVVVDEKTGTVVVGENVRLSKVAVAHGNLHIVVSERPEVVQPNPFSLGQTAEVPRTELGVREDDRRLTLLEGATLQDLVDGLNAIGATPRDLISILRTLKSAGALHADVEVI